MTGQAGGKNCKNRWLKITITADPLLVESISDFLVGVIEAGVETAAPDEELYGVVNGYLNRANPSPQEVEDTLSSISSYLDEIAGILKVERPSLSAELIDEEDWGKNWKKHFKPFVIVPGLVIAPSWEEYHPAPGESVVTMDPGMAFGTGHHATTSLSLECIREGLAKGQGEHLLDVGTGTGILGMAALRFGGKTVLGIDNDPDAVAAAEENVRRNGLDGQMRVTGDPLCDLASCYDMVVANIVKDVLINLSEDLARLTDKGGRLILSGILAGEQEGAITAVFTAKGFRLSAKKQRKEWAALTFVKG